MRRSLRLRKQDKKLAQVSEFLRDDRDIDEQTRNKFAFLDASTRKRKSKSNRFLEPGNEINSTGSFLSDLSVTQSDEDFLDVSKPFKKHRPSVAALNSSFGDKNKRRSMRKSLSDYSRRNKSEWPFKPLNFLAL